MANEVNHQPVWGGVRGVPTGSFRPDTATDVCVVGAGIAGLSTAYNLIKEGLRVLVLDDGPIGGGQTHNTTAHLSNEIDDRYTEIARIHGKDGARLAAHSHSSAIDFIEKTVAREGIDCCFARLDGYLFNPPGGSANLLVEEEKAAREAGLEVEMLPRAPLAHFDTGPCLRFPNQGMFHPLRYLEGLARAITQAGGSIVTRAHVDKVESDGKAALVMLADGRTVRARDVVVATNTPVIDRVTIHTKQAAYLSYVIALAVARGSVERGLYWDTEDPYHYVRLAGLEERDEDLLIVGGEDHKVGQAWDQDARYRRLEEWARARFPQARDLRYEWSGEIMETVDGLGFIGRNPGDVRNVYIATGDSGMGMTHGTIAGILLTDLILGRVNAWADLYDPARMRSGAVGEYIKENLNTALQYSAWMSPGEPVPLTELPLHCGAVVRDGVRKLAVYRDEKGQYHTCSAVCPHLQAIVTWNDKEKTWDCPAHGSRFSPTGKVINGPANTDLEKAESPVLTT